MKRLIILFISLAFSYFSFSQIEIKLEDVGKHVGDSVKVCGKVAGIRFLEGVNNKPTLINLGETFPNQLLTVVIWDDLRKEFEKTPEELFSSKNICVTGKIELFRERPQIVIRKREQLIVID